ncbi:MAG: hypothetical protein HGB11_14675 [Chlorobiales bacterium]|nr:hypothetical protein [Chlorobiales bacterium]
MKMLKYAALLLLIVTSAVAQTQKPESDARYLTITREYTLLPDGGQIYHYSHQLKHPLWYHPLEKKYIEDFSQKTDVGCNLAGRLVVPDIQRISQHDELLKDSEKPH